MIPSQQPSEEQKEICYKIDECKKAIKSFLSPTSSDEENLKHLDFVVNIMPNELLNPKVLEKIITRYPKFLETQNNNDLNLVFYAIILDKLNALEVILDIKQEALNQKNLFGENLILFSLRIYSNNPSDSNNKILKLIFNKQFGRDLQDEEIKNLVEFVDNYNFLKLFYHESGQEMFANNFKSILPTVLPQEAKFYREISF